MGMSVVLTVGRAMVIDGNSVFATGCCFGPSGIGRAVEDKIQLISQHDRLVYIYKSF
jgi:hypothetical protein